MARLLIGYLTRDETGDFLTNSSGRQRIYGLADDVAGGQNVRVHGTVRPDGAVHASSTETSPVASGRPPLFAVRPMPQLAIASRLRATADAWLRDHGFDEIVLPTVWPIAEEYGVEEFTVCHSAMPDSELRLLQSCEFALYPSLAEGLAPCFTFGRCYRHEGQPSAGQPDYLLEFEQLVFASAFVPLEEMMLLAQELVMELARTVGVRLQSDDFSLIAPRDLTGGRESVDLTIEDSLVINVRAVGDSLDGLIRRLEDTEADVTVMPTAAYDADSGIARIAVTAKGAVMEQVKRLLESTRPEWEVELPTSDGKRWNPAWNAYPPLKWRDGEETDSNYPVRSFTSRRVNCADGSIRVADAELYMDGKELAHVRSYAGPEQFREGLRLSAVPDASSRYGYVLDALTDAPPHMTGAFIGWERLVALLSGCASATDLQLLPRSGDGLPRHPIANSRMPVTGA